MRPPQGARAGRVLIVGCGPGAADLLTVRAVRAIESANVILHDSLVTEEILALARTDARRVRVGRRAGQGGTDIDYVARLAAREAAAGAVVARLHGGDPSVFGRLAEELAILERARVAWQVVPGVTASTACAAALGIPLTRRGVAASILISAGSNPEAVRAAAAQPGCTLAFYMAGERAPAIARELIAGGRPITTCAAIVRDATLSSERAWRGTLETLSAAEPEATAGPALLLVGDVLDAAALEVTDGNGHARPERSGLPHDLDADADATRGDDARRLAGGHRRRGQAGD